MSFRNSYKGLKCTFTNVQLEHVVVIYTHTLNSAGFKYSTVVMNWDQ